MDDQAVFSVMAKCFGMVGEEEWRATTRQVVWAEFLDSVRSLMQEDRLLGEIVAPGFVSKMPSPLQTFLTEQEVDALFVPPSYEEKQWFAAQYFTGGLPEAVLPIESLYSRDLSASWPNQGHLTGCYGGPSADYLRTLIANLGLTIPSTYRACPDHLALELDLIAVLLRSDMGQEAREFLVERLAWLSAYRLRLIAVNDEVSFYLALVDVLLGIREHQIEVMAVHV